MWKIFWSRLFVPANLVLVLISGFFILNSFSNYEYRVENSNYESPSNTDVSNIEIEFRVINRQDGYTYVWYSGGVWRIEGGYQLEIGKSYKSKISKTILNPKRGYQEYLLTLGVQGDLILDQGLFVNRVCDWFCRLLALNQKTKRYIFDRFDTVYCKDYFELFEFLESDYNCSNNIALSKGLLIGSNSEFDKQTKENLKTFGLTHLVAVSGFQVVMVASFFESISSRLRLNRSFRILFVIIGVLVLAALVGPQPPVIRSGISSILSIMFLRLFGRKLAAWRSLVYSAWIMLIINPLYLFNLSFQLSFLASLGLVFSIDLEQINAKLFWRSGLQELLGVISTFLFTLPVILTIQNKIAIVGVLSNILVLPVIPFLSLLNLLGLLPLLGGLFLVLAGVIQTLGLGLMKYLADYIPRQEIQPFTEAGILIYYSWLFLFFGYIKISNWLKSF